MVRDPPATQGVFVQIAGITWGTFKGAKRVGWCDCVATLYAELHMIGVGSQQPKNMDIVCKARREPREPPDGQSHLTPGTGQGMCSLEFTSRHMKDKKAIKNSQHRQSMLDWADCFLWQNDLLCGWREKGRHNILWFIKAFDTVSPLILIWELKRWRLETNFQVSWNWSYCHSWRVKINYFTTGSQLVLSRVPQHQQQADTVPYLHQLLEW